MAQLYTAHYTPHTWDTHHRHCCCIYRCLSGRDTCITSYGMYVPRRSFLFLPCKTYYYVIYIYAIQYITLCRVLSVRNRSISCFLYDIIYINVLLYFTVFTTIIVARIMLLYYHYTIYAPFCKCLYSYLFFLFRQQHNTMHCVYARIYGPHGHII